ncbi:MAG: fructose-specific PTS transporter subunit EIIC [Longicatena sp.]
MKFVAITACTTGIAHTYMAAESLEMKAKELNYEIKVETQGTSGPENILSQQDIDEADGIILAVDKKIDETRFSGKKVLRVPASHAIKEPEKCFVEATDSKVTVLVKAVNEEEDLMANVQLGGILQHVMAGVSYMLPLVVAGGILIALSFAFGIYSFEEKGSIAWGLYTVGAGSAFALMVPVMAGFIAQSIANKAGFAAGIVGGMLANTIGAGFLGGIVAGLLAGYVVLLLNKYVKLPKTLQGLKGIVIVPLLSVSIVGLLMLFVIGTPIQFVTVKVTEMLTSLSGGSIIILGLVYGLLYFDLGGPFSKIIYTFGVGALSAGLFVPMGAAMVCGMVPPLGIALATFLRPKEWSKQEKESGKAALVLGLSFITEGAIPFAASNPFATIPACMAGSAVGSIVAFLLNVGIQAPHGGFFLTMIPNAITNVGGFVLAIIAGTLTTCIVLLALKSFQKSRLAK